MGTVDLREPLSQSHVFVSPGIRYVSASEKPKNVPRRQPPQTRKKRPDTRRDELLEAAMRLIAQEHSAGFTVEELTDEARTAKGTFYRYFTTKEQLLATLRDRFVGDLLEHTIARTLKVSSLGWEERIRAFVDASINYYLDNLVLHDVLFHGMWDGGPAAEESGSDRPIVSQLADFISDGVVAGAFRVRDPWLTASLLYSSVHGALDREHHTKKVFDRSRIAQSAVELFLRALMPASQTISPDPQKRHSRNSHQA